MTTTTTTTTSDYSQLKLRNLTDNSFNLYDFSNAKIGIKYDGTSISCLKGTVSGSGCTTYESYDKVTDALTSSTSNYYTCSSTDIDNSKHLCNTANAFLNKTVFDLEKDLIEAINDFNDNYVKYMRCNDKLDNSKTDANNNIIYTGIDPGGTKTPCSDDDSKITITTLQSKLAKATDLANYYKALIERGNVSPYVGTGVTKAQYDASYNYILSTYTDNVKLRNELDLKMNELLNSEKSVSNQYKRINQSVVYTNIAWTVLASSVVYYIFTNLT